MKKYIFKNHNAEIINYLFQILLVTYLLLLLAEQIWSGSASAYINLNYMLIIVIASGILDAFSEHITIGVKKTTKLDYIFAIFIGVLGFIIIKFKTSELGILSWIISIVAGLLIILLSILILEEKDNLGGNNEG